jgi:hypothetical protein
LRIPFTPVGNSQVPDKLLDHADWDAGRSHTRRRSNTELVSLKLVVHAIPVPKSFNGGALSGATVLLLKLRVDIGPHAGQIKKSAAVYSGGSDFPLGL